MPGPTPLTAMEGLSSAQEDAASACKRWLEQAQRAAEAVKESYADAERIRADVQKKERELEQRIKAFEAEREKWQRDAALVADLNARNSDQVKLDIGGTQLATTTRETLVQGDTMLTAMFSGRHKLKIDEEGRVFIDRDADTFSYVLEYLRNGGKLPPLPEGDEQLMERIRAEFDYFCISPATLFPSKRWVDKLKEHKYDAYAVCPTGEGDFVYANVKDRRLVEAVLSDDGEYVAVLYSADGLPDEDFGYTDSCDTRVLFSCASDGSEYEQLLFQPGPDSVFPCGLSVNGYELAFVADSRVVRIVDMRESFHSNSIQSLHDLSGTINGPNLEQTLLADAHVVAGYHTGGAEGQGSRVIVWDRGTSQVIRRLQTEQASPTLYPGMLQGHYLLCRTKRDALELYDLFSPAEGLPSPVRTFPVDARLYCNMHVSGDTLYIFHWESGVLSFSVFDLFTGQPLRQVTAAEETNRSGVRKTRIFGSDSMYWCLGDMLEEVCRLDLVTGEVTTVQTGHPESWENMVLSRDEKRLAVMRGDMPISFYNETIVYTFR